MRFFSKSSSPDKSKAKSRDKHKSRDKDKDKNRDQDRDRDRDRGKGQNTNNKIRDQDRERDWDSHSHRLRRRSRDKRENEKTDDRERTSAHSSRSPTYAHSHSSSNDFRDFQRSSTQKSSPRKSPTKSSRTNLHSHSRSSSDTSKHSATSSSRYFQDYSSHPLNLHPEEIRRRFSVMAAARDETPSAMDLDHEAPPIPNGSSTPPPTSQPNPINGARRVNTERSPTPPPHRLSPSQSQSVETGESFKLIGNRYYKAGDYNLAIQEYNKALEINPNSSVFLSNRAAAYLSANRFREALEDAQRALELDPANPKIMHRLARIYTSLGQPRPALEVLSKVQPPASAKDRAPAETMLRYITQAEDTLKEDRGGSMVLFCLDKARQLLGSGVRQPRKWALMTGEAHLKMGNSNSYGKVHDIAISLLRESSQDPDALLLRAQASYGQGDNEQALKHVKMCLGFDPDSKHAIKLFRVIQRLVRTKEEGNAAFMAKDFQKAAELYTQGLEIDPDNKDINSKLLQNRAHAHLVMKNYDRAIGDCTEALRLDPSYLKALKIRAKAYGAAGNWDEAIRDFKSVAEANPAERGIQDDIRHAEWELKKSMRKDYYNILGVSKDASEQEIKKAYRRMAIQYHPDKNRDGEANDEKFKEIGEAYETLIDPQKRAAYDNGDDLIDPSDILGGRGGPAFATNMGGMGGASFNIDPNVFINMMSGNGGFPRSGGHPFASAHSRGNFNGFPF